MDHALTHHMKIIRRSFALSTLYGIGILEALYMPRYGIECFLVSILATAFIGGFWIKRNWDY
jgi:hypothetical protein